MRGFFCSSPHNYNPPRKVGTHEHFLYYKEQRFVPEKTMRPLIVGVFHGDGVLMDEYGQRRFKKEILPKIGERTLLLLEGGYRRAIVSPKHFEYLQIHEMLTQGYLGVQFSASPSIGLRDGRYRRLHRKLMREKSLLEKAERIIEKFKAKLPPCTSFRKLRRRIRVWRPKIPSLKLSPKKRALVHAYASLLRECDYLLMRTAEKRADRHHVVIVCGAIHALALYYRTGWRLKLFVPDTPKNSRLLLKYYYQSYELAPRTTT